MTTKRTSTIVPWPPSIGWRLLDGGLSDPSVPRRFLKEESWKLLLAPGAVLDEDDAGDQVLRFPVYIPPNLNELAESWLELALQSVIRRKLQQHDITLEASSTKLEFDVVPRLEFEVAPKLLDTRRQEALQRKFRGRELQEWLRLYVKGQYFASQIERADQDHYIFIEEVYCPTDDFNQARSAYLTEYRQPVLIKGIPRAGKTYAALRLLYEVLDYPEASIMLVSSWSDLSKLEDAVRETAVDGGMMFIVFDDPFGVDDYEVNIAATAMDVIGRLAENHSQHRLLITTREEVYRKARSRMSDLRSLECTEIAFEPDITQNHATQYSEILERTAWLHGANWLTQYRRHLNKEVGETESHELRDAWQTVVTQSYVPGVLLSAFILYPQIAYLDMQSPAAVRDLGLALARAVDVQSAFRSELDTLLSYEKSEATLYLMLPSLTLVQDETLTLLFTHEELESLRAELGRYFEPTVGDDFAVYSYRYKLDVFAEVAQDVLEEEGQAFLERSILPELARRVSDLERRIPSEVLVDALTRYFWLGGGIGNQHVVTLMEELKQRSRSAEPGIAFQRDQISVLGTLFQREEPKLGYDLLEKKLTEADPLLVSNVASVLDQLVTAQVGGRNELVWRVIRVVGELLEKYFGSPEINESMLRASLLLHGVLSHLENYFDATREASLAPLPPPGIGAVASAETESVLLGVNALLSRIRRREGDWVRPALMWFDAIIMKLGELRLYLIEHEVVPVTAVDVSTSGGEGPTLSLPDALEQQNIACATLYARLLEELSRVTDTVWQAAESTGLSFLEGGLLFTLAWHNRWCSAEPAANEIAKWADDRGLLTESSDPIAYWRGICFNMAYHAEYFEVKASAWQRESSIYRLRPEKGPRLGADTLHESGLPSDRQQENWKPRFESFYKSCLDQLFPCTSDAPFCPTNEFPDVLVQASFLLGMRAPREPGLREAYMGRICHSLEAETCYWRDDFWRAIAKLFAFNLREPMKVIDAAIGRCGPQAIRRGRGSLSYIIDEVERQLQKRGARDIRQNLDKLLGLLDARQRQS